MHSSPAEAIHEYPDTNEWKVDGIRRAMASLDRGTGIPHECGSLMGDAQKALISETRVRWTPESIHDLSALRAHVLEDDPAATKRVALHILNRASPVGKSATRSPPAAFPEGLPFRKHPWSFPTAFRTMCPKSCAVSPRPPVPEGF